MSSAAEHYDDAERALREAHNGLATNMTQEGVVAFAAVAQAHATLALAAAVRGLRDTQDVHVDLDGEALIRAVTRGQAKRRRESGMRPVQ